MMSAGKVLHWFLNKMFVQCKLWLFPGYEGVVVTYIILYRDDPKFPPRSSTFKVCLLKIN